MKKFLLILFICSKIFGVFSAEENETDSDSSQKEENERRTHDDYSVHSPPQFLQNPTVDWLQDQQGYFKPVAAPTDENLQYSSPKHQQMMHQIPSIEWPINVNVEEGEILFMIY
jgi:hypothetical protein